VDGATELLPKSSNDWDCDSSYGEVELCETAAPEEAGVLTPAWPARATSAKPPKAAADTATTA